MRIKKRKRKVNGKLKFTVVSKDDACSEIIKQKAQEDNIDVFHKGHAKGRLYFRCSPEQWSDFIENINDLCFCESAVIPPSHVQKCIRKNLQKAALNKLDKVSAQTALRILTETNTNKDKSVSQPHAEIGAVKPSVDNNKSAANIKQYPKLTMLKAVIHSLKKCGNLTRFFRKQKRHYAAACS